MQLCFNVHQILNNKTKQKNTQTLQLIKKTTKIKWKKTNILNLENEMSVQ